MSNNYVCLDCGAVFDEPQKYTESHGLDSPPYETFYGCPICGGGYTKALICNCCGDFITDRYAKIGNGKNYCSDCFVIKNIDLEA